MNTKEMVEASTLTALFVIISFIAIATGIGNLVYIDFIVPIIITLIYFKCGKKYTILSSIASILIIILFIGDIATGIFISQSILFGFICGRFIKKEESILDDLLYCSIFSCIVIIIIDVNFSNILGYSILKESQIYVNQLPYLTEELRNVIYYLLIISLPIGTIIITYIVSLFLGKKLNLLNNISSRKFFIIKNFKKYGSIVCCSKKSVNIGVIYLILLYLIFTNKKIEDYAYINILLNSIKYIIIYFLLQDSYKYINKLIFSFSKSRIILILIEIITIYLLINYFVNTTIVIIGISIVIDSFLNLRKKQILYLNKILI